MDIAAPTIRNRVSPAPHLVRTQWLDKKDLVRELARQHPDAGPDEIAARCADWGLPVSAILVARLLQTLRTEAPN